MKIEWKIILGVTLASAVLFMFLSARSVATIGWLALASGFGFSIYTATSGRRAHKYRLFLRGEEKRRDHEAHVFLLTIFILVGVVGIEIAVRKAGGLWGNPWFIAFHLALVLGMAVTFVLARFRYTGRREPSHHWKLVYPFIVFYGLTLITGSILLEDKFHFYGSVPQSAVSQK